MTADDSPRIAFLSHIAAASGAELALMRVATILHDQAQPLTVFFTQDGPVADRLREEGVDTRVVATRFNSASVSIGGSVRKLLAGVVHMVRTGWDLGAELRDYDVVIAESTKALLMGFIASRRAHIPLLWRVHDRITREYFGAAMAIILKVLGLVVSSGYIANSQGSLETLLRIGNRPPATIAYPGVAPIAGEHHSQRAPVDVSIAMVGRLESWKGQDLLLRAVAASAYRPHITMMGGAHFGNNFTDDVEELAHELGLSDQLTIAGHVEDVSSALLDTDILVHCSRLAEPFGQVVVEGMAAGCAVIASQYGGPSEIIVNNVDGLLVDPHDTAAFAVALDRLIGDVALRERLSSTARVSANKFDIALSAATIANFTRDITRGRRGRE